jgi:hypothetical protein
MAALSRELKCSGTNVYARTRDFQFAGRLALMHTLICYNQDVQSRVQAGNLICGFEATSRKKTSHHEATSIFTGSRETLKPDA